ncbi:QueT transporter family protein [bacterium]|nr:QueT transporter family protein [bacterium]
MKDAILMWRDTKMVVLTALIGATYAAVLIPFKVVVPLIPGFTEFRPGSVIPVVFSLMFGPAAAWGAGMGNLIGDMLGGTFGPGSGFGFVGNFLYGYVPYKVWGQMGIFSSGKEPMMRSSRQIGEYVVVAGLASGTCAIFIAWGLDMMGLVPFNALSNLIFVPNFLVGAILGPPLLAALYPRVKRWGLLYSDMGPGSGAAARRRWPLVVLLLVGMGSGYWIGNAFYFGGSGAVAGGMALALRLSPSVATMVLAAALL